jgi:catechol 2,3-dioxygenase-like lactoylglutathione lyase family enzyme
MRIEHVALQVDDPAGVAGWYGQFLGMVVKRSQTVAPFGHFLADDAGAVMIEVYRYPTLAVPDYRSMNPLTFHLAFSAGDVDRDRVRLLAAGATAEGDVQVNDVGDRVAMLRDPWGVPVQLVRRAAPMIA